MYPPPPSTSLRCPCVTRCLQSAPAAPGSRCVRSSLPCDRGDVEPRLSQSAPPGGGPYVDCCGCEVVAVGGGRERKWTILTRTFIIHTAATTRSPALAHGIDPANARPRCEEENRTRQRGSEGARGGARSATPVRSSSQRGRGVAAQRGSSWLISAVYV